jgi:hypothetical protein
MVQVFSGLYPQSYAKATPNFHVRLVHDENLYPNDDFCAYIPSPSLSSFLPPTLSPLHNPIPVLIIHLPNSSSFSPFHSSPFLHSVSKSNIHPSRLKKLSESYSVKAAQEWDPKLKISSSILSPWIPDGITVNGRPKATGILDTINSCIAHGIEMPSELLDERMRRDVEGAAVAEWFQGYLGNFPF